MLNRRPLLCLICSMLGLLPFPSRGGEPPKNLKFGQLELIEAENVEMFIYCEDKLPHHALTTNMVENLVGTQLFDAGIGISSRAEALIKFKKDATTTTPLLSVTVGITKTNDPLLYCYHVEVEVKQICNQLRNRVFGIYPVWTRSSYGVIKPDEAKVVKADIHYYVKQFCTDFLAANPKK